MKIVVCAKQVPDTTEVKLDPKTNTLIRDGVPSIINPDDKAGIEAALQLKEKCPGSTVTVVSMGPPQAKQVIREAFAMGADAGTLLSDRKFGGADVLATSYTLAQGIKASGEFDLILCGRQTTDGDTAQVGPEISEWLNIPSVADVVKINKVEEDGITVSMDLPEEVEIAKVQFPCLLAVNKDIFQPRLPSYVKKTETKEREINVLSLKDMKDTDEMHYGLNGSPTQVQKIFPPAVNDKKEIWNEAGDVLVEKLFDKIVEMKFV